MKEKELLTEILKEFGSGKYPMRLWRHNVGMAYGLGAVKKLISLILARKIESAIAMIKSRGVLTVIKYGIPGQSDIQGIIYPTGRHLWIEVKRPGQLKSEREEQVNWGSMITKMGGIYILTDSIKTVEEELRMEGIEKCSK